jgi:hypothetical protein
MGPAGQVSIAIPTYSTYLVIQYWFVGDILPEYIIASMSLVFGADLFTFDQPNVPASEIPIKANVYYSLFLYWSFIDRALYIFVTQLKALRTSTLR